MPSRRRSGSSWRVGRGSSTGLGHGSSGRSRGFASASSPAPSERTRRSTRRSSVSRASGSDWSRRRRPRRSSSATAMRISLVRWQSRLRRWRSSRSRSVTSRGPRFVRSRSRSAAVRRAHRRCRTNATRSSPSASAGSPASSAARLSSDSRTSRYGTSATSRTRPPSGSSCPMRSWRSITCSTASPGSSRAWSSGPSACAAISTRVTASSSASACCWPSSRAASSVRRPTSSSSETPCAPGRTSRTFSISSVPTRRSPPSSMPRPSALSSISRLTPATSTSSSTACPSSAQGRSPYMPETHLASGKVRELYALDDERLLLVASDRISTFDVVLPTEIPDKGRVLTGLSAFWFARTKAIVPNHLLALRGDGRSMEVRRLEMLPIECVVRGYLAGSGWKDYLAGGATSGHVLPPGMRESEKLTEPIFTPATKAKSGHDENIAREQAAELVGAGLLDEVEAIVTELYRFASEHAAARGIVIADTKFELGLDESGSLVLADEALTPDSSRFWPADEYAPGGAQPSFDKQFVRDYCETLGWDKTDPGPELPGDVVAGTRARYVEAFERLTERSFDSYLDEPESVLR